MKNICTFLLLICLTTATFGQNEPQYSNFMFSKLAYNPAYAGHNNKMSFLALYRNQWSGIEGAPTTAYFSGHTPLLNNTMGVGMAITSDRAGLNNNTYMDLMYAYRLKLKNNASLSIGLQGRVEYTSIDWEKADPLDNEDPLIQQDNEKLWNPNVGVGVFYNQSNFYVGISLPQVLKTNLYQDINIHNDEGDFKTYYFMTGARFSVGKNILFNPNVLVTHNAKTPFEIDYNANFLFMNVLWTGISYRRGDSVDALVHYQFTPNLRAGAAFDFTLTDLESYTNGTFEIMLEYTIPIVEKTKINNLRFFE